jgi:hypothetical protein
MGRTFAAIIFSCVMSLAAAAAQAIPLDVKTGLWQSTLHSELSGAAQGPRTITYKSCLTQKELEEDPVAEPTQKGQACSTKMTSQTRTVWQGTRVCTGAEGRQEYSGKITAVSREKVTGTLLIKMSERGYTMANHAKYESKWLSSSCGNVK